MRCAIVSSNGAATAGAATQEQQERGERGTPRAAPAITPRSRRRAPPAPSPPLRCPGHLRQAGGDALAVGARTVLAHLPLADQRGQRDLDADDRLQHRLDVVVRRIADRPDRRAAAALGGRAAGLVTLGQPGDEGAQPFARRRRSAPCRAPGRRCSSRSAPPCRARPCSDTRPARCSPAAPGRRPANRGRCAPPSTPGWRGRRGRAARPGRRRDRRSSRNGTPLAASPLAPSVTSRPNGCSRIRRCRTSGRLSTKWAAGTSVHRDADRA